MENESFIFITFFKAPPKPHATIKDKRLILPFEESFKMTPYSQQQSVPSIQIFSLNKVVHLIGYNLPCRLVLRKSAEMAHPLARFCWASSPCRPGRRGPNSRWLKDWQMCVAVECASSQQKTGTALEAKFTKPEKNIEKRQRCYFWYINRQPNFGRTCLPDICTCLSISSVTRWTPLCWGLRCIFRWSQPGWPTISPAPTADPEPLLWLAEQAMMTAAIQ